MTPSDDVIRKIQKLFSLAQSPIESEAALAMARAQELLAKYNLDLATVKETFVEGGTVAAPEEKREKTRMKRSAKFAWQRKLWRSLAEANFCWYWVTEVHEPDRWHGKGTKVRVKRHIILGRQSNVVTVQMMGEYLEDSIERLLPYPNAERHSRSAFWWKTGCAARIVERIVEKAEKLKRDSEKNATGEQGLVLLRDVHQREYEANYDTRYGAGAYTRKQISDAKWEEEQKEAEIKAEADRIKAERDWLEYLQNETPEQKKVREKEEARQRRLEERQERRARRRGRSWGRERKEEVVTVDEEAYSAGKKAGASVSLGAQLKDRTIGKERRIK